LEIKKTYERYIANCFTGYNHNPMRKIFALLKSIFFSITAFSQPVTRVNQYTIQPVYGVEKQLVFDMDFGKAEILHITGDTSALRNAGEIMIDMVCTDYPQNLSLANLNKQRLQSFFAMFPYLNKGKVALQNIFRQTDGNTAVKAHTMFHGLVVVFRPLQNDTTMHGDIEKLDQMLDPAEPEKTADSALYKILPKSAPKIEKDTTGKVGKKPQVYLMTILPGGEIKATEHGTVSGGTNLVIASNPIPLDTPVTMSPQKAFKKKIIPQQTYDDFRPYKRIIILVTKSRMAPAKINLKDLDTYTGVDTVKVGAKYRFTAKYPPLDSTVLKVLNRNNFKNATVVGDVTASMYPYTGQLLLWIKLNALDSLADDYVFFNDGNGTPNDQKQLGNTGGIYGRTCTSFDEVKNLATGTMYRGSGGDVPENDIEALLYAERHFPQNTHEILLADNWAPIRDKSLMPQLTKPVDIILCGADDTRIKTEYLNLARQSHGTLHLRDTDVLNLDNMVEGYVLLIGNYRYIIKNNRFEYDY